MNKVREGLVMSRFKLPGHMVPSCMRPVPAATEYVPEHAIEQVFGTASIWEG